MYTPIWFVGNGILYGDGTGFWLHWPGGYAVPIYEADALEMIEKASRDTLSEPLRAS